MAKFTWEHWLIACGAVLFVLLWFVKNIDYDNLGKWRSILRKNGGNWSPAAVIIFVATILVMAFSVYKIVIKLT